MLWKQKKFPDKEQLLEQRLSKIETMYDAVAKEWAEAFRDEHDRKPKDRQILDRFAQKIGDRRPVWDFGCGPGNTAQYLKERGIEISGLDLSENILDEARRCHPAIDFRKGDMLDLDFGNDSLAGVVAFYAIVHFTEAQVETVFREVYRVLQPGGLFLLTYHIGGETMHLDEFLGRKIDIDFMFFTTGFIYGCLDACGFVTIETIEREPYRGVEYESRRAYVFAEKPTARTSS